MNLHMSGASVNFLLSSTTNNCNNNCNVGNNKSYNIFKVFPEFPQIISLFTPHGIPQVWYYYDSHFMDEEAEAQWVNVPSISQRASEVSCSSQTVQLLCLQCLIMGDTWHFIDQLQNSSFANLIILKLETFQTETWDSGEI